MNMHRKRHPGWMLLMGLVLGALLGACGAEQPTGSTVNTASGVVTEGTPTAGLTTCVSCHPVTTADWMLTKHANVEPLGNLYSAGNPTLGQITNCTKNCHDSNGDGAGNAFTTGVTGNVARPVVGCESCHSGGQMHANRGGSGLIGFATTTAMVIGTTSTVQASAQFRTCTGCHELLDPADPAGTLATTATHSTLLPMGTAYVITDTHFATPGVFTGSNGANVKDITGYAMNFSSETVCTDCHNPHKNADINREWAQSAHADKYATDDPLGYFSTAWAHYDWTVASRRPCQRCHTTSGFSAYAGALQAGDASRAYRIAQGTITILSFQATPSFTPEMLKCNGCHTDNKGTLRNPGAFTANYDWPTPISATGKPYARASYAYPDVKGSNVCMACHTGRESGDTVKGLNDPDMVNLALQTAGTHSFFDFSSSGFINSHYLTAGGTVFTATGFEFYGRTYDNLTTYRHDQIGSSAVPNTGTNGPCIGCHMSRPGGSGDHLFLPVSRSTSTVTAGHIEGITSEVCIFCHTVSGAGGLEDLINERKEEFFEAVEATMYVLDKRGFYFRGAHPYFFQKRTDTGSVASIVGATVNNGASVDWVVAGVSASATAPDYFKMDNDGAYYKITAVAAGTITITPAYAGTITTGNYTIIKSGTSAAASVRNWLTQINSGIVTAAATDTDKTGYTTGKYNLGAAFNLNLLEHDPGSYVHNRIYAKRLLYDSIDWADDNLMNNSVGTTLRDLVPAGAVFRAGAMKYLLPYGVLGIPAERP